MISDEPPARLEQTVEDMDPGAQLRIKLKGEKMDGTEFTKTVMLPVGDEKTAAERLAGIGIETRSEEGKTLIDNVVFSSAAEKAGVDFDQEILNIQVPTKRLPKQLMFIPALLLYAAVAFMQRSRKRKLEAAT